MNLGYILELDINDPHAQEKCWDVRERRRASFQLHRQHYSLLVQVQQGPGHQARCGMTL